MKNKNTFISKVQIEGFEKQEFFLAPRGGWTAEKLFLNISQINNGRDPDKKRFILLGRSESNVPKKIAIVKIDAPSGEHFTTIPYLKTLKNNNLKLQLFKTVKVEKRITSYTFYILFQNSKSSFFNDDIKASLEYKTQVTPVRDITIDSISVGDLNISNLGETKIIKINGTPGATFGFALNENFKETVEGEDFFEKVSDVSIKDKELKLTKGKSKFLFKKQTLKSRLSTRLIQVSGYGQALSVFNGTIGKTGTSTVSQTFTSTTIHKTKVNGDKTTTATIVFDNTDGVIVGDRIYATSIPSTSVITVDTVNTDDVTLVLSEPISILNNVGVHFKRARSYSLDIIEDLTSTLGPSVPTTDPAFRLTQLMDPILKVSHSISGSNFTITSDNSFATGLSAGGNYDVNFKGKPNLNTSTIRPHVKSPNVALTSSKIATKAKFSLLLTAASGNFSAINPPKFSKENKNNSSWTNTVPSENNGTDIDIIGVSFSSTGSSTITLTYTLLINKFGTDDVTVELDLDNLVTIS